MTETIEWVDVKDDLPFDGIMVLCQTARGAFFIGHSPSPDGSFWDSRGCHDRPAARWAYIRGKEKEHET